MLMREIFSKPKKPCKKQKLFSFHPVVRYLARQLVHTFEVGMILQRFKQFGLSAVEMHRCDVKSWNEFKSF